MKNQMKSETLEMNEIQFDEKGLKKNSEMKLCDKLIMLTGEFIGTAMLVFFGCIGCIDWGNISSKFQNFYF